MDLIKQIKHKRLSYYERKFIYQLGLCYIETVDDEVLVYDIRDINVFTYNSTLNMIHVEFDDVFGNLHEDENVPYNDIVNILKKYLIPYFKCRIDVGFNFL